MKAYLIDLHIHSNISPCSMLSFKEILENIKIHNINGLVLTDHNSIEGYEKIKKISEKFDIEIFLGYELQVQEGELLIYGLSKVLPKNLPAKIVIEKVKKMGGAVIAAHPFRDFPMSFKNRIYDLDLDGIEITNRNTHQIDINALSAAKKMGVTMVAGSDAHYISDIGWCATKFKHKISSNEELVKEIKEKKTIPLIL